MLFFSTYPPTFALTMHPGLFSPYCDAPCIPQRNNLFQAYKEYRTSGQTIPNLEADATVSVVNHMTTFLKVVENAQITERQAMLSGTSKSAMRSAWDELMKATCCSPTEVLSKTFLYVIHYLKAKC